MRPLLLTSLALALAAAGSARADEVVRVETAHYRLEAETSPEEAAAMGAVLEAAWPRLESFFGTAPRLEEGERLRVYFGATRASFAARLRADGQPVPAAGGYYAPATRTAYLWRQPMRYDTRCLLIHEAAHQFHYLARTQNRAPAAAWYVEGLAEHLGRHAWDGETLRLGVLPTLSLPDYAAAARESLREGTGDLEALLAGEAMHRPLAWALVRYLLEGEDGAHRRTFERIAAKLDRGARGAPALLRPLGGARRLRERLLAWLEEEQEPWQQVFNEWEGIGDGRLEGTAPASIVSVCRVKGPARRLEATLEVPAGPWIGGLLLHHAGRDDYTVALVHGGREVRVNRRAGGGWRRLASAPCPPPAEPGRLRLVAEREEGGVRLEVEGRAIGRWALPGDALGLALQGSTLRFRDVAWEGGAVPAADR